jgi:hypothetical protein
MTIFTDKTLQFNQSQQLALAPVTSLIQRWDLIEILLKFPTGIPSIQIHPPSHSMLLIPVIRPFISINEL